MAILLTERDVRALLPMADLIAAMEQALAAYSARQVAQPVRTVLPFGPERSYFGVMPASLDEPPAVGAKLVTVCHGNHARGLPSHLATIVLLDPETGALAAVLDGRYITEARTAAVSAVSVKHLARPDAGVLALVGSGVQARGHLRALAEVRRLSETRVWSPRADHRSAFARQMQAEMQTPVRATDSVAEAVRGADLIVLATSSPEPVIDDMDVADGAHVCGVGACRPDEAEMPAALVARGRVYVDSRAGALSEAGDLLLPLKAGIIDEGHLAGELGDVVGGAAAGRMTPGDVTIFKSLGMAVEDITAAHLVLERARAQGRGTSFDFI